MYSCGDIGSPSRSHAWSKTVPVEPDIGVKPNDLVLVRFGSPGSQKGADGTQIALVVSIDDDLSGLIVQKWLDHGARWAAKRWIPTRDLRGHPSANDDRATRAAASLGRNLPGAKVSSRGPERRLLSMFIRVARETRGVSQAELAKRLGIKQPSISGMESGKSPLSEATLEKVADALAIDVPTLLREGIAAYDKALTK